MEVLGEILKKRGSIVNNDNNKKYKSKYVINVNNDTNKKKGKYELDRRKFTPNTPETQLAEKIATEFNDLKNYACYLDAINKRGVTDIERLFRSVLSDIKEKANTNYPVRRPGAYFMNKYYYRKY